jgi:DMATS type aromatic prenyltransferase
MMQENEQKKVATKAEEQFDIFSSVLQLPHNEKLFFQKCISPHLGVFPSKWQSWVTDDHSPYDWSVSITPTSFIPRIVFEPQGEEPNLASMKDASTNYLSNLWEMYPHLNRGCMEKISSLIKSQGRNSWFATEFTGRNHFKIYIFFEEQNAYYQALENLGLSTIALEIVNSFAGYNFIVEGISFDLDSSRDSRVKFYLRFMDGLSDYDAFANLVNNCCEVKDELVAAFLKEFVPRSSIKMVKQRYFEENYYPSNFLVAFVLSEKTTDKAVTAKIHVPVRFYYENDLAILEKVLSWIKINIGEHQASAYKRIVEGLASSRSLSKKTGIQSLVAFSCLKKGNPELSVYLSPELYCNNDGQKNE